MTAVSYPLGTPRDADDRGGDCRARDLNLLRNVHGGHRFVATTHCRINNGLLRLTVGASGAAPSLTVEARRGRVTVGDVYVDTYVDLYGGSIGTPAWLSMGVLTIDSPSVSALLTAVRIVRVKPQAITIRLRSPLMADAYVTLKRGERMVHIQHGNTRPPLVDIDRRIRWTASPSPVGMASTGRVEEIVPAFDSFPRFVASIDAVTTDATNFALTAASVTTARFGAGVGVYGVTGDDPGSMHSQLGNTSRDRDVVTL